MREHFEGLARYNAWANHRLYGAVEQLPAAEIELTRPAAFFGSILGTLDHILRADRFWLGNIEHRAGPAGDDRPAESFAALKAARQDEDRRIIALIDRLEPRHFRIRVAYQNDKGQPFETPLSQVLTHLFNHQTHHRGQAHALVKEAGADPPPLDYAYFMKAF